MTDVVRQLSCMSLIYVLGLQVPISCRLNNIDKAGIYYPAEERVECVDLDCEKCKGKTEGARTMPCGGIGSFMEHSANPAQVKYAWRTYFKVQVEGVFAEVFLHCQAVLCCACCMEVF